MSNPYDGGQVGTTGISAGNQNVQPDVATATTLEPYQFVNGATIRFRTPNNGPGAAVINLPDLTLLPDGQRVEITTFVLGTSGLSLDFTAFAGQTVNLAAVLNFTTDYANRTLVVDHETRDWILN